MTREAVNLTQALKGDNKQQGNWGEVVLARVLAESGLREGHEYQTQVSLQNEAGQTLSARCDCSLTAKQTSGGRFENGAGGVRALLQRRERHSTRAGA